MLTPLGVFVHPRWDEADDRGMKGRGKQIIVLGGDLETDHDEDTAWMVQWAVSDGINELYGADWPSFFSFLERQIVRMPHTHLYFHNLPYDMAFIMYPLYDWLAEHDGYALAPIVRMNQVIAVTVYIPEEGKTQFQCHSVTFGDSALKVPGDLRNLAKQTGLPYTKLDGVSDFHPGWSRDGSVDLNEPHSWDYVRQDARIVAGAMNIMYDNGRKKLTASSDAFTELKNIVNRGQWNGTRFRRIFNTPDFTMDTWIRPSYMGGINISTCKGAVEGPLAHVDMHSMYPTCMMRYDMPYGRFYKDNVQPREDQYGILEFNARIKVKSGHIPYLKFKNKGEAMTEGLGCNDPIIETEYEHTFTMTETDIALLERHYDVTYTDFGLWGKALRKPGSEIFGDFIRPNYLKKMQLKGIDPMGYLGAKLNLNSCYGKLGMNPMMDDCTLEYNENGLLHWSAVPYARDDLESYVPMASAITAYARWELMSQCEEVGLSNVIHCDTDSVIFRGKVTDAHNLDTLMGTNDLIEGTDLGYWGDEHPGDSYIRKMWEGGTKRYIMLCADTPRSHKDWAMAFAGVPQKCAADGCPVGMWLEVLDNPEVIAWDGHVLGNEHYRIESDWLREEVRSYGRNPDDMDTRKLVAVNVFGGKVLSPVSFTINDGFSFRHHY